MLLCCHLDINIVIYYLFRRVTLLNLKYKGESMNTLNIRSKILLQG
nr:MAG TPA: hypothetical protein [Caudoviricetes sp.]